jgi:hypothetical protein
MPTLRGHHINLRDPDNIAVELFVLEPDDETQKLLNECLNCRAQADPEPAACGIDPRREAWLGDPSSSGSA